MNTPVETLLADLRRPEAYPRRPDRVDVIQTHCSVVFLTRDEVFKLKKPLDLGFLDYSTPEKRLACCEAEVRLNRRLAPDVYLGVVPITRGADGRLRIGGAGEPPEDHVDHAVHMRRLPRERTLRALVRDPARDLEPVLREVGARLARFHRDAARGPTARRWGCYEVFAGNLAENFTQTRPVVGALISPEDHEALARETWRRAEELEATIEARAARACEGHGDLRLEHVYWLPGEELRIVDGIEFNERFRYGDPALDLAFLVMDLIRVGRRDLSEVLLEAWIAETGDEEARAVLPLYVAYRATVRAKVAGFLWGDPSASEEARARAGEKARALYALASQQLRSHTNVTAGAAPAD